MTEETGMIWYYAEDGQQYGPFTGDSIRAMVDDGKLTADSPVWKSGMAEWKAIKETPDLSPPKMVPTMAGPAATESGEDDATSSSPPPSTPAVEEAETPSSLKLGGGRQFSKVNLKDEDPDGKIDVKDMMATGDTKKGNKQINAQSKLLSKPKVGFFESIGLASFESAFFAVMLVIAGIGCAVKVEYWHGIVMAAGIITIFVANLAFVVRAFIRHWGWGLSVMLIPFAALVYLFVDLKNAYKPVVLSMVGIAAMLTPPSLDSFQQSPIKGTYEEFSETYYEDYIEDFQQQIEEQRQEKDEQLPTD